METLESIVDGLDRNRDAARRLEDALLANPDEWTLVASLRSLRKVEAELTAQFSEAAARADLAVLRYRLFSDDVERLTLANFTDALGSFQRLFTLVFDAIKGGRKMHGKATAEAIRLTAFRPAYLFSGSVGIALTLPKHLYLLGEIELDETMKTVSEMSRCTSSDQVKSYANRVGVAPIRALYHWAGVQSDSNTGTEIAWRESEPVAISLIAQPPELSALKKAIDETSDEEVEVISLSGRLVGGRTTRHTFWLEIEPGTEITGTMDDAVLAASEVVLDKHYRATITRTRRINYATEEEQLKYHLDALEPA